VSLSRGSFYTRLVHTRHVRVQLVQVRSACVRCTSLFLLNVRCVPQIDTRSVVVEGIPCGGVVEGDDLLGGLASGIDLRLSRAERSDGLTLRFPMKGTARDELDQTADGLAYV
jgi:hypothetical protein